LGQGAPDRNIADTILTNDRVEERPHLGAIKLESRPMRCVYVSLFPGDGELVKSYLEYHGIRAVVLNVDNPSVGGGTRNIDGVPTVWIVNDEEELRALQIIEQRGKQDQTLTPWRCDRCHEENDGPFGICWKCGGPAPPLRG
jgi:hypothetical protein